MYFLKLFILKIVIFYNVWNNVFTITIYYYLLFIKEKDGINDII